ncbi:MAG: DNA translocase FtsK [Tenericutes bacterium]|nr:DNA translocase FtsK [Mycoplasmatota bacterium]
MLFKKKRKLERIIPGFSRTDDNREFFIPQINLIEDKKTLRNKFVSPIFGKAVKDEVTIPQDRHGVGDFDKKYDAFRSKKRLTKEEAKRRYGHQYYEFMRVDSSSINKVHTNEGLTNDDLHQKAITEPTPSANDIIDNHAKAVSVDDFFKSAEETISEEKKEIDELDVLKDIVSSDEDNQDVPVEIIEEEREDDEIIYEGDKDIDKEIEEISFSDDFEYQEYKPPVTPTESKPVESQEPGFNYSGYQLPPVSLFKKTVAKTEEEPVWIKENIDIINQTMLSFGIEGEVTNYTKGPTVTRYEISLGSGVPTKKITSISDNIQMSLAAISIRIEAPIPGKNTIGIEVPNKVRESVFFGDVLDNDYFLNSEDPLLLAIGLDIDALPVYTSIETMPHGLVAGSTQSGKSVCIASIITSLITKNKPDEVKMMMIDPKKVDLQQFADIPHLITPIIDDPKIAVESLKYMVNEMEGRYDTLKKFKAINVKDYYSRRRTAPNFIKMPRIVVIIEEASDLLLTGGNDVEDSILKLTQKSRAVGIHLLLATQRPSADILKGAIKANIPARFAFRVPSSTDSSVVLDMTGAEKLLGKGDMLLSENGRARRLQGAYLSPEEIESVTEHIKAQAKPEYMFTHESLAVLAATGEDIDSIDELFKDVANYVVEQGKCSLNKITQVFGIGFNRATQIVNTLEKFAIVSENVGTKPRRVLVEFSQLANIFESIG